jgi:hypothetical protein
MGTRRGTKSRGAYLSYLSLLLKKMLPGSHGDQAENEEPRGLSLLSLTFAKKNSQARPRRRALFRSGKSYVLP